MKRGVLQGLLLMVLIIPGLVALKMMGFLLERTMLILVFVLTVVGAFWLKRNGK